MPVDKSEQYNNPIRLALLILPVLVLDILCYFTDVLFNEASEQSAICDTLSEEGRLLLSMAHRLIYLACFTLQYLVEIIMFPFELLSALIHRGLDLLKL